MCAIVTNLEVIDMNKLVATTTLMFTHTYSDIIWKLLFENHVAVIPNKLCTTRNFELY